MHVSRLGGTSWFCSRHRCMFTVFRLRSTAIGNPHSLNPTSRAMTELEEQARAFVLTFFQTSPDEYTVIFTANATHALKLVGEAYPFRPGSQFLFLDPHGTIDDERVVERRANTFRLSLRTGCFCNPGAGEAAFHLSQETLRKIFHEVSKEALPKLLQGEGSVSWDALLADLGMQSGGAVRISLGLVTNFADVYRTAQFARTFLDTFPAEGDLLPRLHC